MPRIDGWSLIASIAANKARFSASASIAETSALLIIRNQLVLGVRTVEQLRAITDTIGQDALGSVIRALAGAELRRLAEALNLGAPGASPEDLRASILSLVAPAADPSAPAGRSEAAKPLRGHRALGARRIRTTPKT